MQRDEYFIAQATQQALTEVCVICVFVCVCVCVCGGGAQVTLRRSQCSVIFSVEKYEKLNWYM